MNFKATAFQQVEITENDSDNISTRFNPQPIRQTMTDFYKSSPKKRTYLVMKKEDPEEIKKEISR